jgi:hypothetical protein
MNFHESFAPPEALRSALSKLPDLPRSAWLYLPLETGRLTLDTACRICVIDSRNLSPEECDEFEDFPRSIGLRAFLCKEQLEDVLSNLVLQRPAFSDEELEAALNFYRDRDAFIDLDDGDTYK